MTAVASPQPERLPQRAEYDNPLDFVSAHYRQPPVHHPRQAQSSTPLRQELPPPRRQERPRAEPDINRINSKSSVNSKSSRGQNGQRTPSSGESDQSQDAPSARPNAQLVRANSDYGPRRQSSVNKHDASEENWELRHGWEDQYNSTEYLGLLSSVRFWISAHDDPAERSRTSPDQANCVSPRRFTCIIPINGTRRGASRRRKIVLNPRKNGA